MPDVEPRPDQAPTLEDIDTAPEVIPPSSADVPVSTREYAEKLAEVSERAERLNEQTERLEEQVKAETTRTLNDLIKPSATKAFRFMWAYCSAVFLLLLLHGFKAFGFSLPDDVLAFLVGSTATTVLGLVGMVLTGIFIGARR